MKTKEEIFTLQLHWLRDPCWNIETTEGFEDNKDELLQYRLEVEQEWKDQEESRKVDLCLKYHCNTELLQVIESMQKRIHQLEQRAEGDK